MSEPVTSQEVNIPQDLEKEIPPSLTPDGEDENDDDDEEEGEHAANGAGGTWIISIAHAGCIGSKLNGLVRYGV